MSGGARAQSASRTRAVRLPARQGGQPNQKPGQQTQNPGQGGQQGNQTDKPQQNPQK